jgi:hypothetical protein
MYIRYLSFDFCRKSNQLFYYPNFYLCARVRDSFFYRKSIQLFYLAKKKIEFLFCIKLLGITHTPTTTQQMSIQIAIAELIQKHDVMLVRTLAAKYGFDPLEAMASLPRCGAVAPLSKKAAAAAKKATREAKKVAKADKPKRPKTGYLMFCEAERPAIKEDFPELGPQDVICELAQRWKTALSAEDRLAWNDLAKAQAQNGSDEESIQGSVQSDESDLELEQNDD